MFTTLEIHDVNLPNLFYYLTAQYHNDLNTIFRKLLTGSGKSDGRVGRDCRGRVLRRCRPSCLQGPGSCVGLLQVGGWQVGGSGEVCGAWRIRVLQIQNIWNPVWFQPNPPGVPGCRCLALLGPSVHPHLPAVTWGPGCRGGCGVVCVCWRTRPRPGGLLEVSSVLCSVLSLPVISSKNRLNVLKANWILHSAFFFLPRVA